MTHCCGMSASGRPSAAASVACCQWITASSDADVSVADAASPDPRMPSVYTVLQLRDRSAPSRINACTPALLLRQSHAPLRKRFCSLSARAIGSWWLVPINTPYRSAVGPFCASSR